ncbi:MAG: hypothetical protein AB7T49_10705 [Oligoflexales bacterium]
MRNILGLVAFAVMIASCGVGNNASRISENARASEIAQKTYERVTDECSSWISFARGYALYQNTCEPEANGYWKWKRIDDHSVELTFINRATCQSSPAGRVDFDSGFSQAVWTQGQELRSFDRREVFRPFRIINPCP